MKNYTPNTSIMDLSPWGLTNTSGNHLSCQEEAQNASKRKTNRRRKTRRGVQARLSQRSWGGLEVDVDSTHSKPSIINNDDDTRTCSQNQQRRSQRRSSNSSWAGLEVVLGSDHSTTQEELVAVAVASDKKKKKKKKKKKDRNTRSTRTSNSSWGDLEIELSSHHSCSSLHSKSSWAGLDVLADMERPSSPNEYYKSYNVEESEHDFDYNESLLLELAMKQDKKQSLQSVSATEETYSQQEDDDDDEPGNGCWLDFDLDELSDSDTDSDDDDYDDDDCERDDE